MPRFRNRSPINRSRIGIRRSPDRSRVRRRRCPSVDRTRRPERKSRKSEIRRRVRQRRSPSAAAAAPPPSTGIDYSQWFCLGVFGISHRTTEDDLRRIFQRYGPIERIRIVYDPMTRKSRGFGFIYLRRRRDALVARDECDGMLFDRQRIRVDVSRTEKPHSPTPGQYMGPERRGRRVIRRKSRERTRTTESRAVRRIPIERKSPSPKASFVHPRFRPVRSRVRSSESE